MDGRGQVVSRKSFLLKIRRRQQIWRTQATVSLLLEDTVNQLPAVMVRLLLGHQPPPATLNSNLGAIPLNSQEATRPRAAATHQLLVSMSECELC